MPFSPPDLPVNEVVGAVAEALDQRGTAVLVAPPGAGKTTVVPLVLAEHPWLDGRRIVMLEPRRLATRAAATRMASLLGETVGATVGYQTRDERHIGPATRIEVVTEGVLTRRLQHDPELPGVGLVIFDEVHERNLPTDVGLALALDVRRTIRPDLRLLAMSATPDTDRLAALLGDREGGRPAPVVESDGRMFPVDLRWVPMAKKARVTDACSDAVARAVRDETGDVLVFLPGIGEIRTVQRLLEGRLPPDVDVHALAGALSLAEQDVALAPSPPGRRRVVLSTDIAESSLTVDGVRVVVDAGLARVPRYDVGTGMTKLATITCSRASADQRAGRAGRVEPGVAYRLWSKLEHATRRAHLEAEITQVDLSGLVLELAVWGTAAADLPFIDPPPARALQQGRELLALLGALDAEGHPTASGRSMLALPLHPRLARMVATAGDDDHALACAIAAILDERDVLRGRVDELPADIAVRVEAVCGIGGHDRADRRAVERVRGRAVDIARRSRRPISSDAGYLDVDPRRSGEVLVLAYPDRLAVRRSQPGQFQLRTGNGAWVAKDDDLAREPFVVAAELDGNRTSARIRMGAALDADAIARSFGDAIDRREALVWDKQTGELRVRVERRLGSMLLDEMSIAAPPGEATTAALVDRVRTTRLRALGGVDRARGLRDRVAFVRRAGLGASGGAAWPDWSDAALVAHLDVWLAPFLVGAASAADLQRLDLSMLLSSQLSWDQQTDLAELAPVHLKAPSGREVTIDYAGDAPRASIRVQQLFGLAEHPTVGGGKVAVTLELLSPADRPIQITSDLPGFWAGSWAQVRKDMAGRYPKHDWPADPSPR